MSSSNSGRHGGRGDLRRDARRYNRLVAYRWLVLRFAWEDVMFEPLPRRRWPVFAGAIALACSAAAFTMRDTHSSPASIDHGATFVDDDGKRYELFQRASTIAVNAAGKTTDLLQANLAWERGAVEAPWMTKRAGYYYLFYRAANQLGVARATSPLGPYDKLTRPIGSPNEPVTFVNGWPRAAH